MPPNSIGSSNKNSGSEPGAIERSLFTLIKFSLPTYHFSFSIVELKWKGDLCGHLVSDIDHLVSCLCLYWPVIISLPIICQFHFVDFEFIFQGGRRRQ